MGKLQYGKSYIHYFFITAGITIIFVVFDFGKFISLLTFSLGILFLSAMQLYSGIALNRAGKADCRKEDHPIQFYLAIINSFVVGVSMLIMAFV